jgi:hypothetical protein
MMCKIQTDSQFENRYMYSYSRAILCEKLRYQFKYDKPCHACGDYGSLVWGGVNQGLLPSMEIEPISEEESHKLSACHLLKLRWRPRAMNWTIHSKWCKTEKKEKSDPAGYRTRVAGSVVGIINHYTTNASWKKRMMRYVISLRCTCSVAQSKFTRWQYDLKWSTIINFAKCVLN